MFRLLAFRGGTRAESPRPAGERNDPLAGLVAEVLRGNPQAERTLFVTLGPSLLRVVRGILGAHHPDVEDVLQECMVSVHEALPTFRGDCMTVHFASRVAVHTAMNARRHAGHVARHTPSVAPDDLAERPDPSPSPAEAAASARRRAALNDLLDELPDVQAEVLALHVVLGYSVEETATVTRAPHNTVRSRLRMALARLRDRVRGDEATFEAVAEDI
jgi:RNA polymerase sigma-70 factor (ECF subfamily)